MVKDIWRYQNHIRENFSDISLLEWKYFSFSSKNVQGFFTYSVGNPTNILGLKKHILSYSIYYKDTCENGYIEVPKKFCYLNRDTIWNFGKSYIKNNDKDEWEINGETSNLSINIKYNKIAKGGQSRTDLGKTIFGSSWMDWIVLCNSANISGTLKIKNTNEEIIFEGFGYYDSNLGHWAPSGNLWTWGHSINKIENDIIALSVGEARGKKKGMGLMYVSINEKTIPLSHNAFNLTYDQKKKPPNRYYLTAQSNNQKLTIKADIRILRTDLLTIRAFHLIPLLKLYTQRGRIKVNLEYKNKTYSFDGEVGWEFPKLF